MVEYELVIEQHGSIPTFPVYFNESQKTDNILMSFWLSYSGVQSNSALHDAKLLFSQLVDIIKSTSTLLLIKGAEKS